MIRKSIRRWVVLGLVLLTSFGSGATVNAKTISVNFDDGGNPIGAGVAAGFVPAINWNNLSSGSEIIGLTLNDSTGAATSVTLRTWQGFNGTNNAPGGGATAGDAKLWAQGTRSVHGGFGNNEATQVLLQGLSAAFPLGYDVYFYVADTSYTFAFPQGGGVAPGGLYESNTAGVYTSARTNDPALNTLPASITDTKTFSVANNSNFNGAYTLGGNYNVFTGKSADTAVYTLMAGSSAGGGTFNWYNVAGFQIVGADLPPVPEPSTFVLGLVGLVGLAFAVWGRRRRSLTRSHG
ncbi:MAG: PEP-CTERM sorting domain-containing protein [Planctomycetes bacterium]|nr:PEP-CTERM sorting domain-containing protein [Planctomycetota bacterium]